MVTTRYLLLLLLLQSSLQMDINHEGREIILQHDIETVLITTKLSPMREELENLSTGLRKVKQNLVSDVQNAMVKNQRAINKALLDLVRVAPDCNRSYCEDSFSGYSGSV